MDVAVDVAEGASSSPSRLNPVQTQNSIYPASSSSPDSKLIILYILLYHIILKNLKTFSEICNYLRLENDSK